MLGPDDHFAAVAQRAVARVAGRVVEEGKREGDAALAIDGDEPAIAYARHVEKHARLELLQAGRSSAIRRRRRRARHERGIAGRH